MTVVMLDTMTAAAVDLDRRVIEGLIVPFGVAGLTSLGRLAVAPGALVWSSDLTRLKLTREHDRTTPLAYCEALEPRREGLWARFRVSATPMGDTALLEASERVRDGLSVDLVDVVLSADGSTVTAGRIAAVGLCSVPAYDDARVTRVAATEQPDTEQPDTEPDTEGSDPMNPDTQTPPRVDEPPSVDAPPTTTPVVAPTPADPEQGSRAVTATVPAGSPARTASRGPLTLQAAAEAIAATARGDLSPAALMAALSDFTTAPASGGAAIPPQWVGNLWDAADVARPHVDAINGPRPLTSLKVQGFQWVETLDVGPWNGDKAAIPSNAPTLAPAEEGVSRWAGGVDVAREFIDLGAGDVVRDLLVQATNDYRGKTDLACLADLLAGGTAVGAGSAMEALSVIRSELWKIRRTPTLVALASDLFEEIANTPGNTLAFASGSISGNNGDVNGQGFINDPDLPAGKALGLVRSGATFYERGPINVDALNIAQGGIDEAVFGYTATLINRQAAIVVVTVTTVPLSQSSSSQSSS